MLTPTSTDIAIILFTVLLVYAIALALRVAAFSLAPVALAGAAAYVSAVLSVRNGVSIPVSMTIGVLTGTLLAVVTAVPLTRVRGVYSALMTVALVVVGTSVASSLEVTGGTLGLVGVPAIDLRWFLIVILALTVALFWYLDHSTAGRRVAVVQHDEVLAGVLRVGVTRTRMIAFILSGVIASMAGVSYAHSVYFLAPSAFSFALAISVAVYVIVSGSDHWLAPLVAAGPLALLSVTTANLGNTSAIVGGLLAIVVVIIYPSGVGGALRRLLRYRRLPTVGAETRRDDPERPDASPVPLRLEIDGVSVTYGAVRALKNASLAIGGPGCYGIIGPNGSGKSTLVGAVSGTVRLDGGAVDLMRDDHRRPISAADIGRCFQTPRLVPNLRAWENIALNAHDVPGPGERALGLARQVGLTDAELAAWPRELPTGTRKKVELARALMTEPAVLLLDEPAAGLSAGEVKEMAALIRQTARHSLVILVEHNLKVIYDLCDMVTLLVDGEVTETGPPSQMRESSLVAEVYLGAPAGAGTSIGP